MPIVLPLKPAPRSHLTDWNRPHPLALAAAFALLASLTLASRVQAGEAEDRVAEARQLVQEANTQYAVGEFLQAAEKYQKAYKLKQDPALLYNAAQSYRMAGNNEKALLLYKNYVMFHPNSKNVPNVEQQIQKLQEAIAAQDKARTQPPTSTEPTSGNSGQTEAANANAGGASTISSVRTVPAAPPPDTSSATAATVTATPTPAGSADEPIYKKWWLWTAIGAVVIGGVVTALLLTRSESPWNTAPDFGPGASKLVGP
jgi:tetratricopeptide (TPR) repeat protein